MKFGELRIPSELVRAHESGNVVFFAGAGVSIDPPSGLMDFGELATTIGRDAGVPAPEGQASDAYLHQLATDYADISVHDRVVHLLSPHSSRPNATHRALAELAAVGPAVRIVTTNYDEHITAALAAMDVTPEVFSAPALPLGNDFEGVVHLHGLLSGDPQRLVVTAGDFGAAYMIDAWAARFLERMFGRYHVVFLGYSLDDVVMQYLTRGLRPGPGRYIVLPSTRDTKHALRHGLQSITYPAEDDHTALPVGLTEWATSSAKGALGHVWRIRELTRTVPTGDPDEEDYLASTIIDPSRVRAFTDHATGLDWLEWVAAHDVFRDLFRQNAPASAVSQEMAWWFSKVFISDPELSGPALEIARRCGGHLSPRLWREVGLALHRVKSEHRGPWLDPWLYMLMRDDPGDNLHLLEYALYACSWPRDQRLILALFEHLTRPLPANVRGLGPAVGIRGDRHWLDDAYASLLKPNLGDCAEELLGISVRALALHHDIENAGRISTWGRLSFGRSSIAKHPQDSMRESSDVVIDAARDALRWLSTHTSWVEHRLETLMSSTTPILRRLAVHTTSRRPSISADEKLRWMLRWDIIHEPELHHETFDLLAGAVKHADEGTVDELLSVIEKAPDDGRQDGHEHRRLTLLTWIRDHGQPTDEVESRIKNILDRAPTLEVSDHSDFLSYHWSGHRESVQLGTVEDLHRRTLEDPASALAWLNTTRDQPVVSDLPTWDDALALVRAAVATEPLHGDTLFRATEDAEIRGAVVDGWSKSKEAGEAATIILGTLLATERSEILRLAIARMLSRGGTAQHPTSWAAHPDARALAIAVWDELTTHDPMPLENRSDWLTRSVNHPAGDIATYFTKVVGEQWRTAGDAWAGFPAELANDLTALLDGEQERHFLAGSYLASRLHFLHGADPMWTEEKVLAKFDWSHQTWSEATWNGFLYHGRVSQDLLKRGFLTHLQSTWRQDLALDDLERLSSHLASVIVMGDIDSLDFLMDLSAINSVSSRTSLLRDIARIFERLTPEQADTAWDTWLRRYWNERIKGAPRNLEQSEASALATCVTSLAGHYDEAVECTLRKPAHLLPHSRLLYLMAREEALQGREATSVVFLTHLLKNTEPPFWEGHHLEEIVSSLSAVVPPATLHDLRSEAYRLGCAGAETW